MHILYREGVSVSPLKTSPHRASTLVQTLVLSTRFCKDHLRRKWIVASHIVATVYISGTHAIPCVILILCVSQTSHVFVYLYLPPPTLPSLNVGMYVWS